MLIVSPVFVSKTVHKGIHINFVLCYDKDQLSQYSAIIVYNKNLIIAKENNTIYRPENFQDHSLRMYVCVPIYVLRSIGKLKGRNNTQSIKILIHYSVSNSPSNLLAG